jgi:hypothetical protein
MFSSISSVPSAGMRRYSDQSALTDTKAPEDIRGNIIYSYQDLSASKNGSYCLTANPLSVKEKSCRRRKKKKTGRKTGAVP